LEPPTVLIVDDDADMRLYLRSCLETLGSRIARVLEAADGLTALRLARSGAVDLVISDVVLPGLSGRTLCEAIRADARLSGIPVLLISGEDDAARTDAADAFLAKPFNAQQLLAALEGLLPVSARSPPDG
jgi:CheY-like chemotaxis protein